MIGAVGRATITGDAADALRSLGFERWVNGAADQWERPGITAAHLIYVTNTPPHGQPFVLERWENGVCVSRTRWCTQCGVVDAARLLIGPFGV